jgi:hypothetical protein
MELPSIPTMMGPGSDSKPSVGIPSHSSHNQAPVSNIQHVLHTMPQFLQQTHQTQEHEVTPDYLQQLLKDKKLLQDLQPNLTQPFTHMDRLLEDGKSLFISICLFFILLYVFGRSVFFGHHGTEKFMNFLANFLQVNIRESYSKKGQCLVSEWEQSFDTYTWSKYAL